MTNIAHGYLLRSNCWSFI